MVPAMNAVAPSSTAASLPQHCSRPALLLVLLVLVVLVLVLLLSGRSAERLSSTTSPAPPSW